MNQEKRSRSVILRLRHGRSLALAVVLATAVACRTGPEEPFTMESWEVALTEAPQAPTTPVRPEMPELRSWGDCAGWIAVEHEEALDADTGEPFSWCAPPPIPRLRAGSYHTPLEEDEGEGERPTCDPAVDGTYPLVGHAECQPLGTPCPAGTFPEVPSDVPGRRLYVLADSPDGDGTEESPFGTIGEALLEASDGDVVVVGAGRYTEALRLDQGVVLWGRCVRDTIIEGPVLDDLDPPDDAAITVATTAPVVLRNLRVTGASYGVAIRTNAQVAIEGVWIHGTTGNGVYSDGASELEISGSLVSSVADPAPTSTIFGAGIHVWASGGGGARRVVIRSSTIEDAVNGAMIGEQDDVSLQNVLVRNTSPAFGAAGLGRGVGLDSDADVRLSHVVVDGASTNGIIATSSRPVRTTTTLEDVVVRRTALNPAALDTLHAGLFFTTEVDVVATRTLLEDNSDVGVFLLSGVDVTFEDLVVLRSGSLTPERNFGQAILTRHEPAFLPGPRLTVSRGLFDENSFETLYILGAERAALDDLWIEDTLPSLEEHGFGVLVDESTEVDINRALVQRNGENGVVLWNTEDVDLQDLTILETPGSTKRVSGAGLNLDFITSGRVAKVLVSGSRAVGFASGEATLEVDDLTVLDTGVSTEIDSWAIQLSSGADTTLRNVHIEDSWRYDISVMGEGTTAHIEDLTVSESPTDCEAESCAEAIGVSVDSGAHLTLVRASMADCAVSGLFLEGEGTVVEATDLTIAGTRGAGAVDLTPAGVRVRDGASLTLTRARLEDNAGAGLLVTGVGTEAVVESLDVARAVPAEHALDLAAGLSVSDGATVTLTKGRFVENAEMGILARGAQKVSLADVLVTETRCDRRGRFGRGVNVQGGGEIVIRDSQLLGDHDASLAVFDAETTVSLDHVLIADTLPRACLDLDGADACEEGRGYGLSVVDDARVMISDLEVRGTASAGVQIVDSIDVGGESLVIHHCALGANHQGVTRYEVEEAFEEFLLIQNDASFDDGPMSIPERAP